MYTINLSPMRRDDPLMLSAAGSVLVINGEALDLQDLQNGAILPMSAVDCEWLASDIVRGADGQITLTLIFPVAAGAPESARFPAPIHVDENGEITLPAAVNTTEERA